MVVQQPNETDFSCLIVFFLSAASLIVALLSYVSALIRRDRTSRGLRFMQSQTAEAGTRAVTRTDFGDQIV